MAEDKKHQAGGTEQVPENDPMHGRTHNSQNPEIEEQGNKRDKSGVDHQVGNMNHGESGDRLTPSKQ